RVAGHIFRLLRPRRSRSQLRQTAAFRLVSLLLAIRCAGVCQREGRTVVDERERYEQKQRRARAMTDEERREITARANKMLEHMRQHGCNLAEAAEATRG